MLIETILAAFEMDEILYELRDHIVGLNCGRWDYIFSFIKKFRNRPDFVLPDRALVTMTTHFLKSYSELTIKTCHRRGAFAMGGMAAQIPIKSDAEANAVALQKVRDDKVREATDGHDGTWVAHPGLVPIAMEVFNERMPGPISSTGCATTCTSPRPICWPFPGPDHRSGPAHQHQRRAPLPGELAARLGLRADLQPDGRRRDLRDLTHPDLAMDPASPGVLDDGRKITAELFRSFMDEELGKIRADIGPEAYDQGKYPLAREVFDQVTTSPTLVDS